MQKRREMLLMVDLVCKSQSDVCMYLFCLNACKFIGEIVYFCILLGLFCVCNSASYCVKKWDCSDKIGNFFISLGHFQAYCFAFLAELVYGFICINFSLFCILFSPTLFLQVIKNLAFENKLGKFSIIFIYCNLFLQPCLFF